MSAAGTNSSGTAWTAPPNGIVGGYEGGNPVILRALTAFTAIAWYNAIETIILVLARFKKRTSLYFWSMIITSFAVVVYSYGAWGKMEQIPADNQILTVTFLNVGWIFMVCGQSIVLYSRLHYITQSRVVLRSVLWLIIINTIVLYIPTTTLTYGANLHYRNRHFVDGYNYMERTQMVCFTLQELIISAIYMIESAKFLRIIREERSRRIMYELLLVNVCLIVLDVALLSVEFESLYEIEVTLKGMVYSLKLKLELGVLSKLVELLHTRRESFRVTSPDGDLDLKRFGSATINNNVITKTTSRKSGRRTSSLTRQWSPKTYRDEDHVAIDFGDGDYEKYERPYGKPLNGPREDEVTALELAIPELIHRRESHASSITKMYPGRIKGETDGG